jgi:hypothetical protein
MNRPPTDSDLLIAALAEQARGAAPPGSEVPEPETLAGYLAGDLSPEEEEALARQLAASPEAVGALLDLADFEAARAEAGREPADLAVRAGWQDFRKQLAPPAPPRFRRWPLLPSSLAAALLACSLGLGFGWRQEHLAMIRPVANLVAFDLLVRPRAGGPQKVKVKPGAGVLFQVEPPEGGCPAYSGTITSESGGESALIEKLEPDSRGILTFSWHPRPGAYALRLSDCKHAITTYWFRIERDAG